MSQLRVSGWTRIQLRLESCSSTFHRAPQTFSQILGVLVFWSFEAQEGSALSKTMRILFANSEAN
jgi:hypothetical protein